MAALEEMKQATSLLDVASSAPQGEAPADAGKSAQEGGGEAGSGSLKTRKSSPGWVGGLMLTQHAGVVDQDDKIGLISTHSSRSGFGKAGIRTWKVSGRQKAQPFDGPLDRIVGRRSFMDLPCASKRTACSQY